MHEWLNGTSIIATLAFLLGVVNSVFIYLRLGHDIKLKKAEIAVKMVELEYERLARFEPPGGTLIYGPQQLLDIYLPVIDEIYEKGTYDAKTFDERRKRRLEELREVDMKKKR